MHQRAHFIYILAFWTLALVPSSGAQDGWRSSTRDRSVNDPSALSQVHITAQSPDRSPWEYQGPRPQSSRTVSVPEFSRRSNPQPTRRADRTLSELSPDDYDPRSDSRRFNRPQYDRNSRPDYSRRRSAELAIQGGPPLDEEPYYPEVDLGQPPAPPYGGQEYVPPDPFGGIIEDPYAPYQPETGPPGFWDNQWHRIKAGPVLDYPSAYIFALVEGFDVADLDSQAAGRFGLNVGLPIAGSITRLAAQVGTSGSIVEEGGQFFFSGGGFYRSPVGNCKFFNIGAVVDLMRLEWLNLDAAQVRARASISLSDHAEFGAWGATSIRDDEANTGSSYRTVDQANLFFRWLWPAGSDLSIWAGWRSDPSGFALGGDFSVPLNDAWVWTIGGSWADKAGSWNAYTGIALYFGGQSREQFLGEFRNQPYLPVANNTRMSIFLDN